MTFEEPRYPAEELAGIVPVDYRKPVDVREVIARLVDGSDFLEFKALYGMQTIVGHAAIEGHAVGIVGNNGPIDADGSTKAAHFIQACSQSNTPIVYLQNTTGYMVGREAEAAGIVKHGSKMIQAVANATVPQITLHIGASFGAGNYGMCGRGFDPRFIFAWPNNRIAVMGGAQAAKVMSIVSEEKSKREGTPVDRAALDKMEAGIIKRMEAESTALYATARLLGRRPHRPARLAQRAGVLPLDLPRGGHAPAEADHVRRRADVSRITSPPPRRPRPPAASPLPPSSGMRSTETTFSVPSVRKMRTPCVLRPATRTSWIGQRMSWPPSVTSMIWSLSSTGNEATRSPLRSFTTMAAMPLPPRPEVRYS